MSDKDQLREDLREAINDETDNRPFTAAERKAIRKLLEQDARAKWLWSTLRTWVGWGAATIAALYSIREHIKNVAKAIFS